MKILSIETSCDETAIAILDIKGPVDSPEVKILANALLSQVAIHEQYGGVFPTLAKREHEKNLPILLEKVLKEASSYKLTADSLDFIAVTAGPGLEPALWAGIVFAEELGKKLGKPVIPVDHMKGHIYSVLYRTESISKFEIRNSKLAMPALALLVSGGHTELVKINDFGSYEILGRTLDDAIGEAFDKVARMLGLSYPGGPKISQLADRSRERLSELNFKLPRPMIHSGDLNFSYSGLKTAVLYKIKAEGKDDLSAQVDEEFKEDMARAFEDAAIEVIIEKTRKALEDSIGGVKTLIVGGGVAANKKLSEDLKILISQFPEITLRMPERSLTTDNAIMIGLAAFVDVSINPSILENPPEFRARGNLSISSHSFQ